MKYVSEFRNREAAKAITAQIREIAGQRRIKIMEVCGGHTVAIFKYGLKNLLPKNISLLSGPGCPVCVTANRYIDYAITLSRLQDVIVTSFGDMIRVPGSQSNLLREKSRGADVRICYSPLDSLKIAKENPLKKVVFLGIGFETTAPTIATVVKRAHDEKLTNFSTLTAIKTMPHAMKALVTSGELDLNGMICPGHVSTITGTGIYEFLAKEYKTPCVISGFEPLDLLQSVLMIAKQITENRAEVENQYTRTTMVEGNKIAQTLLREVFVEWDAEWRGLGVIPKSGLVLNSKYSAFDAEKVFPIELKASKDNPACLCGAIMRGVKTPNDCRLFGKACTPESPIGACMVSDEGSCATYYKYAR